ncbi:carbamoyltransferase HypF [Candidatus Thorarchaeota archaeon]|nr:MAG: carbamoyltransferase HypF [Candidatus Thorarchaeota archaeon]
MNTGIHLARCTSVQKRARVHITGIVQGVGFRPFIYRLAIEHSLQGYVLNLGDAGVRVIVEGEERKIQNFIHEIKRKPPSISRIETLHTEWMEASGNFDGFKIRKSSTGRSKNAAPEIPPDIAICQECITDLFDPKSRWYLYPFTSCAACGPRFSTITNLPYDRPNTTMDDFPLCDSCNTGYTDPLDRRYHAQTTACERCGPSYRLFDNAGELVDKEKPVASAATMLEKGMIVALHGISGTHLATMTTDHDPIRELRRRKRRSSRPFAVMFRDIETVKLQFELTDMELGFLTSWRRPIVLLSIGKNDVSPVIPHSSLKEIAPGLDTIGVMLPYAPVHHLLFEYLEEPALIMTSANPSGLPMYIEPERIVSELSHITDFSLIHDRRIHQRADDSVIKPLTESRAVFIRRSRGYVPEPIEIIGPWAHLTGTAVGPEEKVTGAVLKAGNVYLTQYIGDTDRLETVDFLSDALTHIRNLVDVPNPGFVACDLNPQFLTTEMAEELNKRHDVPLVRVQHHHAHLAGLIAEHGLPYDSRIVCITVDGYGYSPTGDAWGGEILLGDYEQYQRVGGLTHNILPGGDLSARYAVRSLLGIAGEDLNLSQMMKLSDGYNVAPATRASKDTIAVMQESIHKGINTVNTTSAGRFLDAVSLVLGICGENSYDGECPMRLEAIARDTGLRLQPTFVDSEDGMNLDTKNLLLQVIHTTESGASRQGLAFAVLHTLGTGLARRACDVAEEYGLTHIGLSGGVALNKIITRGFIDHVHNRELTALIHERVPPGDGGISLGQIAVGVRAMV